MSDLISREKIHDYIKGQINPYGKPFEGTAYELGLKIMRYIDAMDSAYDIDKVVEELEKAKVILANEYYCKTIHDKKDCENSNCFECCADYLIEIVKQGGVSNDVCEWKSDCHLENDNPDEWLISPHNPKRIFSTDIIYCPYCGKKIKIVGD